MSRLRKVVCSMVITVAAVGLGMLLAFVARNPLRAEPRELYAAVSAHLAACRAENYPLAYHAASKTLQGRLSVSQFERKLRADYSPMRRVDHVEFGPTRVYRADGDRAELEVYFVLNRRGEVIVRRYELLREEGDWKVDRSDPILGEGDGERLRLTGRRA